MQSMRWLALLTAATVITACFFTWVSLEEKHFYIGGFFSSEGNRFGQPGLFHLILCSIYILFLLINRVWSLRTAFFVSAFNIAWAVRNFMLISACSGGVCPEKHTGLYAILIGSILLMVLTAFVRPSKNLSVH
jgi:hypothetical protein